MSSLINNIYMLTKTIQHTLTILYIFLLAGCTVPSQLKSHISYNLHDIVVDNDAILVTIEKNRKEYKLSVGATITSEPPHLKYSVQSHALLTFSKEEILNNKEGSIQHVKKLDLIVKRNDSTSSRFKIINKEQLLQTHYNHRNNKTERYILDLAGGITYKRISTKNISRTYPTKIDPSKLYYSSNHDSYLFITQSGITKKLPYSLNSENERHIYPTHIENVFIESVPSNKSIDKNPYQIVDKKRNVILSQLDIRGYFIEDCALNKNLILSRKHRELFVQNFVEDEIKSYQDDLLTWTKKALLYADYVLVLGKRKINTLMEKSEHLTIFVWNIKTNHSYWKYYPLNAANLEVYGK